MEKKQILLVVLVFLGIACIICCCVAAVFGGFFFLQEESATNPEFSLRAPTATLDPLLPTRTLQPTIPIAQPTLAQLPEAQFSDDILLRSAENLETLKNVNVPIADDADLAMRLRGIENVPTTLEEPAAAYQVGDEKTFWLTNMDNNTNFQATTHLAYGTRHALWWIENGVDYDPNHLEDLAETFENHIYPKAREFFGSEWRPGIDHDDRLYIVYARGLGFNIAGYFSSIDSLHPLVNQYSNGHETFMLNADTIGLNERFTYGVLAHEFQHMIHWYQDRNETSWLNEGFSELAALLTGYYESGFDRLYLADTNLQLNDWPNDPFATTPHYGAGFLFVTYFLDRFGDEATKALVAHPKNGMESVDAVLAELGKLDGLTGEPIFADDVFRDWTVTNVLNDVGVSDGRYGYYSLPSPMWASITDSISDCDDVPLSAAVKQYGALYYEIECPANSILQFRGGQLVSLLPERAFSGEYSFWSNKGDHSNMTLTGSFDFSEVTPGEIIEMEFQMWYDIETDYDYLYLLASEDGNRWEFITTPRGTASDPVGNNFGWGYTGTSNGWVKETVDLSDFAGKEVWLRFEYVTDAAVNGEGLLLDDVSIPVINYHNDFEAGDGGWLADGFARVSNDLPQKAIVTLINTYADGLVQVIPLVLNDQQAGAAELLFSENLIKSILVVSGSTRFTRTPAQFEFWFE